MPCPLASPRLHAVGRRDLTKRFTSELRAIAERLQPANCPDLGFHHTTTCTSATAGPSSSNPSLSTLPRTELIQYILDKVSQLEKNVAVRKYCNGDEGAGHQ